MKWAARIGLPATLILLMAGCTTPPGTSAGASPPSDATIKGQAATNLSFFTASQAPQILYGQNPSTPGVKATGAAALDLAILDNTNQLAGACGTVPNAAQDRVLPAILYAIVDWAVGQIVTLTVNAVDSELQTYLKTYTASYSAKNKTPVDLYQLFNPSYPLGDRSQSVCFRLTRYKADSLSPSPASTPDVASDFVGRIEYDPGSRALLRIRPLRLYYASFDDIVAKTAPDSKGEETVIVNVTVTPTDYYIQDQGIGESDLAAIDLGSVPIERSATTAPTAHGHFYYLYPADDATGTHQHGVTAKSVQVPLFSWDIGQRGAGPRHNSMTWDVKVSEAGNPPALAKFLANLVHTNASDAIKSLSSASQLYVDCKIDSSQTKCK